MEPMNEPMSYDSGAYQRLAKICIDHRKKRGMSQAMLAKELGITQTYLSCIENNKKDPSFGIIMKICMITGTPIEYIANGELTTKEEQFFEHMKAMFSIFDEESKNFVMNVMNSIVDQYAKVFENKESTK